MSLTDKLKFPEQIISPSEQTLLEQWRANHKLILEYLKEKIISIDDIPDFGLAGVNQPDLKRVKGTYSDLTNFNIISLGKNEKIDSARYVDSNSEFNYQRLLYDFYGLAFQASYDKDEVRTEGIMVFQNLRMFFEEQNEQTNQNDQKEDFSIGLKKYKENFCRDFSDQAEHWIAVTPPLMDSSEEEREFFSSLEKFKDYLTKLNYLTLNPKYFQTYFLEGFVFSSEKAYFKEESKQTGTMFSTMIRFKAQETLVRALDIIYRPLEPQPVINH